MWGPQKRRESLDSCAHALPVGGKNDFSDALTRDGKGRSPHYRAGPSLIVGIARILLIGGVTGIRVLGLGLANCVRVVDCRVLCVLCVFRFDFGFGGVLGSLL